METNWKVSDNVKRLVVWTIIHIALSPFTTNKECGGYMTLPSILPLGHVGLFRLSSSLSNQKGYLVLSCSSLTSPSPTHDIWLTWDNSSLHSLFSCPSICITGGCPSAYFMIFTIIQRCIKGNGSDAGFEDIYSGTMITSYNIYILDY